MGTESESRWRWEKAGWNCRIQAGFPASSHDFPPFPGFSHLFPLNFFTGQAQLGSPPGRARSGSGAHGVHALPCRHVSFALWREFVCADWAGG